MKIQTRTPRSASSGDSSGEALKNAMGRRGRSVRCWIVRRKARDIFFWWGEERGGSMRFGFCDLISI